MALSHYTTGSDETSPVALLLSLWFTIISQFEALHSALEAESGDVIEAEIQFSHYDGDLDLEIRDSSGTIVPNSISMLSASWPYSCSWAHSRSSGKMPGLGPPALSISSYTLSSFLTVLPRRMTVAPWAA
jgi:hypothetical protein